MRGASPRVARVVAVIRRVGMLGAACLTGLAVGASAQEPQVDPWKDPDFQKRFVGTYGVLGELEPRVSQVERTQLEAIIPLMSSDLAKARDQLQAGIKPDSSAVLDFTLGNILFQLDEPAQAAESYRKAVEKFPSFLRAHKNLGLACSRSGDTDCAIGAFARMIELGGADSLAYGLLGQAHAARQDYLSAESAYRQALLLQPESLEWKLGLVRCLIRQERHAEAATLCGELIQKHPDRTDLMQLQAAAFVGMKEPLKAAQNYEMLARLGKASVSNLNTLGDIYVNEGLMDPAVRAYTEALKLDPDQPLDKPLRSIEVMAQRGATSQAKTLIAAIKQAAPGRLGQPESLRLLKLEARLAVAEGLGGEAATILEQVVAIDPLDGEALLLLGQHHARAGDKEKAMFYFERAENIESVEAEARLRHAQVLVNQLRYGEALPLLRRAQELKPRDEVARYLDQVERLARSGR